LGALYVGTLVTDRLASYNFVARRQLCLAHLLRDAQAMSERHGKGAAIGSALVALFRKGIALFHDQREARITRDAMRKHGRLLQKECAALLSAGVALKDECDRKTRGTCKKILASANALWTFLKTPGVEPTNNIAERAIRPAVIVRKRSFGSDSEQGATFFARILSAVTSLRAQFRPVFAFFENTLIAARSGSNTPSMIPQDAR
jgi:transposase